MIWGILIGLFIAFVIWVFGSGMAEASRMIMWRGERYKLVGGIPNSRCRHDLGLSQQVNGIEMRGCTHCNGAFIKWADMMRVDYDR